MNRPLLSFVTWTRAVVLAVIMLMLFAACVGFALCGDDGTTFAEMFSVFTPAYACILLGMVSCLTTRWSFYEDRVECCRYGFFKTVLKFRDLISLGVSNVPAEERRRISAIVTEVRRQSGGSIPPAFAITLQGYTPEGTLSTLFLLSNTFHKHAEAEWALSHIIAHCPSKVRHSITGSNMDGCLWGLLFFGKWTLIFIGCVLVWGEMGGFKENDRKQPHQLYSR